MSNFKLFSRMDVVDSLSRVTGKGFEDSLYAVNRFQFERPEISDQFGNFDIKAFGCHLLKGFSNVCK